MYEGFAKSWSQEMAVWLEEQKKMRFKLKFKWQQGVIQGTITDCPDSGGWLAVAAIAIKALFGMPTSHLRISASESQLCFWF